MHRVNLPLTLSLPPAPQQKAGKKRWPFQVCPEPRAGGETQRTPSGHSPLSRDVRAFQDGPAAPESYLTTGGERTLLSPPLRERPYFLPASAAGMRIRSSESTQAPGLRFPEPPAAAQPEVPLLFAGERGAALRIPPRWKPRRGGASLRPLSRITRSRDYRLQRTDPRLHPPSSEVLTSPQSLRFPRRLLHRPIAPQRLLGFQMGRQRLFQLHRWSSRAGLQVSPYSIPAAGCREGGGSSQQCFKGLGARDAAPSLPPPGPGSTNWYPGVGEGCRTHAQRRRWGGWVERIEGR